jgi:pimeloyl-ACP methyl ester carboxylesterase
LAKETLKYYSFKVDLHLEELFSLSGLQTTMGSWLKQMQYFAELPEYCCCYIDNRGVGLSGAPTGAYTYDYSRELCILKCRTSGMARDTLTLVNHLQWSQYHLVGLSMGGMIALELALMDAARLLSLTLMVTHAGGPASYIPVCSTLCALSHP